MRICILANPRTGSSSLYLLIRQHLPKSYHSVSEPFNSEYMDITSDERNHIELIENSEDVFIKHICYQYPPKYKSKELWYDWLFSNFDKIILLDRKDRQAQSESMVFHQHKKHMDWYTKSYYDLDGIEQSKINDRIDILESDGKFLLEKSKDYPLFYYEDLFVEKNNDKISEMFNYLGIKPIEKFVEQLVYSDNRKVRKDHKNTNLI